MTAIIMEADTTQATVSTTGLTPQTPTTASSLTRSTSSTTTRTSTLVTLLEGPSHLTTCLLVTPSTDQYLTAPSTRPTSTSRTLLCTIMMIIIMIITININPQVNQKTTILPCFIPSCKLAIQVPDPSSFISSQFSLIPFYYIYFLMNFCLLRTCFSCQQFCVAIVKTAKKNSIKSNLLKPKVLLQSLFLDLIMKQIRGS